MRQTPRPATGTRNVGAIVALAVCGGLLLAGFLLNASAFNAPARTWQPEGQPPPAKVRVRFEAQGTYRDRATGWPQAETHATVGVGEGITRYLAAGGGDDPDICHAGFVNDAAALHGGYVWQLRADVVAVSAAKTTVQLRWSRSQANQGAMQEEAGDTRTVTLRVGDYQNVDYVSAPPGLRSGCSNLLLRVLAEPLPQPDPQPLLTLDLWLAHDGRNGRRWVHQQVHGRSGQPVAFRLDPLAWAPSGAPIKARSDQPVIGMGANGTIVATMRPEGFLDVSVQATRSLTWGRTRVDGEGDQDFRCAANEAVALLLPDARGRAASAAPVTGTRVAPGVLAGGDKTVVDFARFFGGSETTLYVVVRPSL